MTYTVDPSTRAHFKEAGAFFDGNPIGELVFYEKYSRWDEELGRRETWPETVARSVGFLRELSENRLPEETYREIEDAILHMRILPSMRLLAMAGKAGRRNNISLYNCAFEPIDSIDAFVEALIISMNGTGLGYSVERKYVQQLPEVLPRFAYGQRFLRVHTIADSAEGWAEALRVGLTAWFNGDDVYFDFRLVRPSGSVLRTKGGRASGPEPLKRMLDFARTTIHGAQGRKLTPLECHDIMGNIALGAVSGGHRRSAMIALYDWNDDELRHCKDGEFWETAPWRTTANNSAVFTGDHHGDGGALRDHFRAMVDGGNGEPGLFNRMSSRSHRPQRRADAEFGTNPCGEIALRPRQFCNLTEVILRPDDTQGTILEKVRLATIVGTIQSKATYFPGLRAEWWENCEEERLLGVGFTGQMDCPRFQDAEVMATCRAWAGIWNTHYAERLGINPSASITCVKPSGSTSLLAGCSSGLHDRWAPYSERNVRLMATGPVARAYLASMGPADPENGQTWDSLDTIVAHFPLAAPKGSSTRGARSAVEQMEYALLCKEHLTEHNPSVTITYRPEETQAVEDCIVRNIDKIGGMTWFPHFDEDTNLKQMPNREMTEAEYRQKVAEFPEIDYSLMTIFEQADMTSASQEPACVSGACEIQ